MESIKVLEDVGRTLLIVTDGSKKSKEAFYVNPSNNYLTFFRPALSNFIERMIK